MELCDRSDHAILDHGVVDIDYMIDHNQYNCHDTNTVDIIFSHIFPTFAIFFYKL